MFGWTPGLLGCENIDFWVFVSPPDTNGFHLTCAMHLQMKLGDAVLATSQLAATNNHLCCGRRYGVCVTFNVILCSTIQTSRKALATRACVRVTRKLSPMHAFHMGLIQAVEPKIDMVEIKIVANASIAFMAFAYVESILLCKLRHHQYPIGPGPYCTTHISI